MKLAIVIVNYKLKYFIEQTLLSVAEATQGIDCRTIVVDNASGDGCADFLRERFPDITIVENKENVGFSKANNQGFDLAHDADYILVLNPDTIICRQTVDDCINWMDSRPDCASIGVRMLDGNGHFLPESKRSFPTIWNSFCKLFGLSRLFPRSRTFARYHLRYLPDDKPNEVQVLAGAYMFLRGDKLREVGGFDETFFMYGEDMDLAYRMASDGMKNYYLPSPVIHYKGECTKTESVNYVKIFYGAMHIFYRKHYPQRQWLSKIFVTSAIVIRMTMSLISKKIVKPFLRLFTLKKKKKSLMTYVLSDNTDVMATAVNEGFDPDNCALVESPDDIPSKPCNVILDDSRMTYSEIIRTIDKYSDDNRLFHIYSSRNSIIISPKRQR